MQLIEIIEVRTSQNSKLLLEKYLKQIIKETQNESKNLGVKLYQRMNLELDFSIHIIIGSDEHNLENSKIGYRIASALKEFGIVYHSVWIEKGIE